MIVEAAERIAAATGHLCALDAAIGDGDHGTNMKRGFDALLGKAEEIAGRGPGAALIETGRTLVMTIGGASGPLYGSFFLAAGAAMEKGLRVPQDGAAIFGAGVEAVSARGRSIAGEKTMLDVLVPVLQALCSNEAGLTGRLRAVARRSADLTAPMLATKGRAAYLGTRSVGHVDPGAKSCCLIIEALCDVWEASA